MTINKSKKNVTKSIWQKERSGLKKVRNKSEIEELPSILILADPVSAAPSDQITLNMYKYSMSTGSMMSRGRWASITQHNCFIMSMFVTGTACFSFWPISPSTIPVERRGEVRREGMKTEMREVRWGEVRGKDGTDTGRRGRDVLGQERK
jgi:hypothetical protein